MSIPLPFPRWVAAGSFLLLAVSAAAASETSLPIAEPGTVGVPGASRILDRSWSARSGVPSNVDGLAFDGEGFLWLRTADAWFRFDGTGFDAFDPQVGPGIELEWRCEDAVDVDDGCVLEGPSGERWVASPEGLSRQSSGLPRLWNGAGSLKDEQITSVSRAGDGALWVSGRRRGLFRLEPPFVGLDLEPVPTPTGELWAACELPNGDLAIGSADQGAFVGKVVREASWDTVRWTSIHGPENPPLVFRILCASDGSIWVGGFHGLDRYADGELRHFEDSSGLGSVRGLYEDSLGRIWAAWASGVTRYSQEGDVFKVWGREDGLPVARTTAFWDDAARNGGGEVGEPWVWVATGGGLVAVDGDDRIRRLRPHPSLGPIAADITFLAGDDFGTLWLGTDATMARIPLTDLRRAAEGDSSAPWPLETLPLETLPLETWRLETWDRRHGLPPDWMEMAVSEPHPPVGGAEGPGLWAASRGGLMLMAVPEAPPGAVVRLAEVTYDGRNLEPAMLGHTESAKSGEVSAGGAAWNLLRKDGGADGEVSAEVIRLPPRPKPLGLRLTVPALGLDPPSRIRYRLDPASRGPIEDGVLSVTEARHALVFAGLEPGNYVLTAMAADRRGVFNGPTYQVRIEVAPGWGQTPSTRIAIGLFLILSMVALHRARLKVLLWREQRLDAEAMAALEQVRVLRGLLPICACCKKIRDDDGIWNQLEGFLEQHSEASLAGSQCPDCRSGSSLSEAES